MKCDIWKNTPSKNYINAKKGVLTSNYWHYSKEEKRNLSTALKD